MDHWIALVQKSNNLLPSTCPCHYRTYYGLPSGTQLLVPLGHIFLNKKEDRIMLIYFRMIISLPFTIYIHSNDRTVPGAAVFVGASVVVSSTKKFTFSGYFYELLFIRICEIIILLIQFHLFVRLLYIFYTFCTFWDNLPPERLQLRQNSRQGVEFQLSMG